MDMVVASIDFETEEEVKEVMRRAKDLENKSNRVIADLKRFFFL